MGDALNSREPDPPHSERPGVTLERISWMVRLNFVDLSNRTPFELRRNQFSQIQSITVAQVECRFQCEHRSFHS